MYFSHAINRTILNNMKFNTLIISILCLVIFNSCAPKQERISKKIAALELKGDDDVEAKKELAELYGDYVDLGLNDSLTRPYLGNTLDLNIELENHEEIVRRVDQYNELYPNTFEANSHLYSKAKALNSLGKHGEALNTMKAYNMKKTKLDFDEMSFYGVAYQEFIEKNPNDSLTPKYQLELANVMSVLGNKKGAVEQFSKFYETYPLNTAAPYAMMQAADITDKHLKDTAKARLILEDLIAKYPEHPFGVEAQTILDRGYLGKTDAEILQDIVKRNKASS